MTQFKWTKQKGDVALGLAEGKTQMKVAEECGIQRKTIYLWLSDPEFSAEVDRLTLMTGIASRAERLRIAKRVVQQKIRDEIIFTDKDLLDWMKFVRDETDGIKVGLAEIAAAIADA